MNTKDIVYIALFCALTAALGLVPKYDLPGGVPITAQSMGVMIAGGILGATRGGLALALFAGLVAAGLPLMSGFRGGLALFAGPSGGFIVGFILGAALVGLIIERFWRGLNYGHAVLACVAGGIVGVYGVAIPWWALAADITPYQAFTQCLAFVPGDVIKALLASAVILSVKRAYPLIETTRAA